MKKFLLLILLTTGGFFLKGQAQAGCMAGANNCDIAVSNFVITIQNTNVISATQCELTVDISFDLSYNSGNKYIILHSWLTSNYPSYFPCSGGAKTAPTNTNGGQLGVGANDIGKSFTDIGLDNTVSRGAVGVPVNIPILTSYPPQTTLELTTPTNSPGMTATKTFISGTTDKVILKNVKVTVNSPCNGGLIVKTDVWSSNAANLNVAQCWVAGITQSFNDPSVSFFKICGNPNRYSIGLTTVSPTNINATYQLYADVDHDGFFEPGTDDPLILTSGPHTINSGSSYSATNQPFPHPFGTIEPYASADIWVKVDVAEYGNSMVRNFANTCASLPVNLKSFTAVRDRSNVNLKWETVTEENNLGFDIQRMIGVGQWETVGFIASQAVNGNSNSLLTYQFNDFNATKGITQYRLMQKDIDGKFAYSAIRSVRGDGQKGKTIVYPNPSNDGKVNVVFEDVNVIRDISLIDMNGRIIKQWNSISNNNIQIDNLVPGFYTVRIVNKETGEQDVEKIIVNKR